MMALLIFFACSTFSYALSQQQNEIWTDDNPAYLFGEEIAMQEMSRESIDRLNLLNKVRERGSLEVRVYLKMENYDSLPIQFYRVEISQKYTAFMSEIKDLNVQQVKPFNGSPVVSIIVDENAFLQIVEMEIVEKVTGVRRGRTF